MKAKEALTILLEGNGRHINEKMQHSCQDKIRLQETEAGQSPMAAVITCSDSRVVPTIFFDQGIGDIFAIRVGGNIIDDTVLGSLEYAVEQLGVRLVMVIGHTNCGSVIAALDDVRPAGYLGTITEVIKPAVETARKQGGDLLNNAIKENVSNSVTAIKKSSNIINKFMQEADLELIPAIYDLATGKVNIM